MKKQSIKKVISTIIIFTFVISLFQNIPIVNAANNGMSDYYSNPNQNSAGAYKFKISDIVNSNLLTSVVGCTGVVNKVAGWMSKIIQSPLKQAQMLEEEASKILEQMQNACSSIKAGSEAAGDSVPVIGGLSKAIDTVFSKVKMKINGKDIKTCQDAVNNTSLEEVKALKKAADKENENSFKEQCLDGIAITLAKNQLTSMTRSAMNWVNSGYGGNPFFVQNMQRFTTGIENNVIETGIDVLLNPGNENPYARDFARTTYNSRNLLSSSSGLLGSLTSDLQNFVTSPTSFYTEEQLDGAVNTEIALQRARQANNEFARDFSVGGWNGWLALTQKESNNPLGYNMLANQYLADMQGQQTLNMKEEITQNNGFMSQKECIQWQIYDGEGNPKRKNVAGTGGQNGLMQMTEFIFTSVKPAPTKPADGYGECVDWKVITPGGLIKDKVSNYLNSPERQLELADTINDSLNALFSVLISKLQSGGLSSLSDSVVTDVNWTDNINSLRDSSSGSSAYDNNDAYSGFNLTRDLGNTYIYDTRESIGEWDAELNITTTLNTQTDPDSYEKLYPGIAPLYVKSGETSTVPKNVYYTVSRVGKTKIMNEGYNEWLVGDRAFWDGEKWQNWKKGQANPVKKRGVVQIQQDYVIAAKALLKVLPGIMPALGELDYCLPGPNPNYKINSSNAQAAYSDWVGTMYIGAMDSSNERWGVKIDTIGDRVYEDLHNIYKDVNNKIDEGIWSSILSKGGYKPIGTATTPGTLIYLFSNMCNNKQGEYEGIDLLIDNCRGSYTYIKNGNFKDQDTNNVAFKQKYVDNALEYTNNFMFQKFYDIFDQKMNKLYFKKLTNPYIEKENVTLDITDPKQKNPAFIKMADSGFDFTRNILSYSDDTIKAQKDYNDAVNQAKVNIAKLEPIKQEVSQIIQEAQNERKKQLYKKLGINTDDTAKINEFNTKYKSCFDEEDIKFYDISDIMNSGDMRSAEACFDGVDNDLDGLTDSKDSDCGGVSDTRNRNTPRERTGGDIKGVWLDTPTVTTTVNYRCENSGTEEIIGDAIRGMRSGCTATSEYLCENSYDEGYSDSGILSNFRCQWVQY